VPKGDKVDYVDIIQVANILSHRANRSRWTDMDIGGNLTCKRVGLELIARLENRTAEDDSESELSSMLN
jgi:hypothetical protein